MRNNYRPKGRQSNERAPQRGQHSNSRRGGITLPQGRIVVGRNTVFEVLKASPERILLLLIGESVQGEGSEILKFAEAEGVPIEQLSRQELTALVTTEHHQSVAAVLKERQFGTERELADLFKKSGPVLVLALDGVEDPQNFGTILRAAECFGADGVVWSKNRGSGLTTTASKTAVGASELLSLFPVSNLATALKKAKEQGAWLVTTNIGAGAKSLDTFEFPEKTLLIFGSEGEGVSRVVTELAEYQVYIPMSGRIDSLNVSQATAVTLYEYRRRFPKKHAFQG